MDDKLKEKIYECLSKDVSPETIVEMLNANVDIDINEVYRMKSIISSEKTVTPQGIIVPLIGFEIAENFV